ncbi:MAG: CopG family ribbon-helix-helix protein [Desulfurococcales archaeon]|nr:CopG family ribbon-helix-helix protein [Desulfurococcales archaeon]
MVVISVSLPSSLVRKLNELASRLGYKSRSELVKDAVLEYLSSKGEISNAPYSVIIVVSDHESEPKVDKRIIEVIHDYETEIVSYQHQMLEGGLCITTIITKGFPPHTAPLLRSLRSIRGVLEAQLLGVGLGKELEQGGV